MTSTFSFISKYSPNRMKLKEAQRVQSQESRLEQKHHSLLLCHSAAGQGVQRWRGGKKRKNRGRGTESNTETYKHIRSGTHIYKRSYVKHNGGDSKNYLSLKKLQMFSMATVKPVTCNSALKLLLHFQKSSTLLSGGEMPIIIMIVFCRDRKYRQSWF